jgi:hypothetical protein
VKVYVVEEGVYAERWVSGVYASLEAAQEANPIPEQPTTTTYDGQGWRQVREGHWTNGLDYGELVAITEYDVIGEAE